MSKYADWTCFERNKGLKLNRAKDYYENDKERFREKARDKSGNLSEEEKSKKEEYGRNGYQNISDEKKQRLKEYQKSYRETNNFQYNNE